MLPPCIHTSSLEIQFQVHTYVSLYMVYIYTYLYIYMIDRTAFFPSGVFYLVFSIYLYICIYPFWTKSLLSAGQEVNVSTE